MQLPGEISASRPRIDAEPITVTLTLSSQPHQNRLATRLRQQDMLRRVISFGPELEIFDPSGAADLKLMRRFRFYRLGNRVLWGLWRRTPGSNYSRNLPVVIATTIADWLAARWVPPCTIFHSWGAICLVSMRAAKRSGAITMIENAILHPRAWQKAVVKECDAFSLNPRDCRATLPSALIRRMEREYEICDHIIVPSAIARQSFEEAGLGDKTIVVHAGVDHNFFSPRAVLAPRDLFRVCYVGRVELAKGVPYLLQAWRQLELAKSELVIIGVVSPEMLPLIERYALPNVRFMGLLPPSQVVDHYRDSNLFVFPSVNEGLARVLLEAMATGLPVIATEESGARDCVSPGVDGTIIPARNVVALGEAILWHYRNPEATTVMGEAARGKIEAAFTLSHYEERMIAVYHRVARERGSFR